jgi:hypothetical protein
LERHGFMKDFPTRQIASFVPAGARENKSARRSNVQR